MQDPKYSASIEFLALYCASLRKEDEKGPYGDIIKSMSMRDYIETCIDKDQLLEDIVNKINEEQ